MTQRTMEPENGEVDFHFEKAAAFRVVHVDGAFGGLSPSGRHIHMTVFSERQPIPRKVVHQIAAGVLGPEIVERRETRTGVFRELEADLVLTKEAALAIREWLEQRIAELTQAEEAMVGMAEGTRLKS